MTIARAVDGDWRSSLALLLGASTMALALIAAVFFETYEGPGLVGNKALGAVALSLFLLAAFVIVVRKAPLTPRARLGLVLALFAHLVAFPLAAVMIATVNALGLYW